MSCKDTSGHVAEGLAWFKSSYSDTSEPSDCLEVAITPATIHIRDSKRPHGPRLAVTRTAWAGFVGAAATSAP
ncbi:DUF397 domain-containing protein [Streptomyces coelicoflavus]|uniref:DUF397 domain-containing protein n=1 Tax=Streptomyces coelicoflavus TaxID=285562 RepID=UPI00210A621D|nr:DUF397 domain-containing protein [Streptomyces coelicoflavus]MCQ4202328.1 DUF397 domain-containing protein [Streptomyces coelicoflavus]